MLQCDLWIVYITCVVVKLQCFILLFLQKAAPKKAAKGADETKDAKAAAAKAE